jgi:glycosyltransferase involved in cell wall biosynthesis
MRLLFVHQNFPGQYPHLAHHYAARAGHEVVALGEKANLLRRPKIPGVRLFGYTLEEKRFDAFDAPVLKALHRGRAVAAAAMALRRGGFSPDIVFAHIGWGEALFLKDAFPAARLLLYCEFFYRAQGGDLGFDPEFPARGDALLRVRVMNAPLLMSLHAADWGMAPTVWQQGRFPAGARSRITVIHDGIDTDAMTPGEPPQEEIITYVARNLEPYRGFHVFMRAIPEIQKRRPRARIVIVGGDEVSYSPQLPPGETYRARLLREMEGRIDLSRVQFAGRLPYADYLSLLRKSSVHVYLTYPFVLSWSLIEAMAAGCLIVASRTPPVEEVIADGRNGLLFDFFSAEDLATRIDEAMKNQDCLRPLRENARRTAVERYDLRRVCLPRQLQLVQALQRQRADARAAAHVEHLAGDEAGVTVSEEQHRPRDVVGLS